MADIEAIAGQMAPTGRLRVALNHGNPVLVARGRDPEHPTGVSVALARELAARLGLALDFQHHDRAGDVSAGASTDSWDLCFLAVDPLRAESISFSPPYVAIEGCYVLRDGVVAQNAAEVDAQGLRIGMTKGSAYALHLARAAGGADLVTFETLAEGVEALRQGQLDGLAGVRQAVARIAREGQGLRVLDDPFMAILQAMGVPAGRSQAAAYVSAFIEEMKASGFVARALAESGHGDVRVP